MSYGTQGFRLYATALKSSTYVTAVLVCLLIAATARGNDKRPFSISDDIELSHFGDPYTGKAEAIQFSPDGRYVAVYTERGRLQLDRPEGTLRIYRSRDIGGALHGADVSAVPPPLWALSRSTANSGPIVSSWRWLPDSSAIAFLERRTNGDNELLLAYVKSKTVEPLSLKDQAVRAFDIRDQKTYVYAVVAPNHDEEAQVDRNAPAVVATGRLLE